MNTLSFNPFLDCLYRLSVIKRYSTHRVNFIQNPSSHSFNVTLLALYIADCDDPDEKKINRALLLKKALLHDFPEGLVGDIPATSKHYSKEINSGIKRMEADLMRQLFAQLPVNYSNLIANAKNGPEGDLIAICDLIERLIYVNQEKTSGNQVFDTMVFDTQNLLKTTKYKRILKKWPTATELIKHFLGALGL